MSKMTAYRSVHLFSGIVLSLSLIFVTATAALCRPFPGRPATRAQIAAASPSVPVTMLEPLPNSLPAEDARLDRPVTLDEISVPLDELLREVSREEGGDRLRLEAGADCADLKVQVRLNQRPLRVLMRALAEMLPGAWRRDDVRGGYRLEMNRVAVDRRAEWWRLFLGEREKALAAQKLAALDAMRQEPYRRRPSDPDPEHSDRQVEAAFGHHQEFFHALPPDMQQQIAADLDDRAFYGLKDIRFGGWIEAGGTLVPVSQLPPEARSALLGSARVYADRITRDAPAFADQVRSDLPTQSSDFNRGYIEVRNAGCVLLGVPYNCPKSLGFIDLHVPIRMDVFLLMLDQNPLIETLRWRKDAPKGKAVPDEWKRLIAYQQSRVWPNALPPVPRDTLHAWKPAVSRAAQLEWLGDQGHMEFVADYYSRGGYSMPEAQRKTPLTRPLEKELNEIAARRDVSWKKSLDGIYLVRDNRWYRDDRLEVPQPLLRRWFGALLQARRRFLQDRAQPQKPVLPQSPEERLTALKAAWDWAAEVVETLTPWQIWNGLARFQPEEKGLTAANDDTFQKVYAAVGRPPEFLHGPPAGFDPVRDQLQMPPFSSQTSILEGFLNTARFYDGLDNQAREALLTGRLLFVSLNPVQRQQAISLQPRLPGVLAGDPAVPVLLGLAPLGQPPSRVSGEDLFPMRLVIASPPLAP